MITVNLYSDEEIGELEDTMLSDGCQFCGSPEKPFVQNDGRTFERHPCTYEYWVEGPFSVRCDECNRESIRKKTPKLAILAWKRKALKKARPAKKEVRFA